MEETLFSDVYGLFLNKISDIKLATLDDEVLEETMKRYLLSSCSRFKKVCKQSLAYDDDYFVEELDYQVIDILSECMIVEWLKPRMMYHENLENVLNTKDFSQFSPANLLKEIRELYNFYNRQVRSMINDYSFEHQKLEDYKYDK